MKSENQKKNNSMRPILMEEEYWANTQLSIVRHYGSIIFNDAQYTVVNKEGRTVFELSVEAEREGREKAIPPGEPCDLVMDQFIPVYRKVGREAFIRMLKENSGLTLERAKELAGINDNK